MSPIGGHATPGKGFKSPQAHAAPLTTPQPCHPNGRRDRPPPGEISPSEFIPPETLHTVTTERASKRQSAPNLRHFLSSTPAVPGFVAHLLTCPYPSEEYSRQSESALGRTCRAPPPTTQETPMTAPPLSLRLHRPPRRTTARRRTGVLAAVAGLVVGEPQPALDLLRLLVPGRDDEDWQ